MDQRTRSAPAAKEASIRRTALRMGHQLGDFVAGFVACGRCTASGDARPRVYTVDRLDEPCPGQSATPDTQDAS